ncbi:MAG: CcmD family protein [Ignavibacteriaceae bacterium]|nr:CcmD family protein [Ignavibacteriaceae bacterium]
MEDFLGKYSIYIVLIIVLIVWGGIFGFLNILDRRLKKLTKEVAVEDVSSAPESSFKKN